MRKDAHARWATVLVALMLFLGSGLASATEDEIPGIPCDCPQHPIDPLPDPLPDYLSVPEPEGTWVPVFVILLLLSPR